MKQSLKLLNFKKTNPEYIEACIEELNQTPEGQVIKLTYKILKKHIDEKLLEEKKIKALSKGEDLWKKTCFECFFFDTNSDKYFEVNVSPDGQYDLFSFEKYRQKSSTPAPIEISELIIEKDQDFVSVSLQIKHKLNTKHSLFPTVILDTPSEQLFFALKHQDSKPNFHKR